MRRERQHRRVLSPRALEITRRQIALRPTCVCEVAYLHTKCTDTDSSKTHVLLLLGLPSESTLTLPCLSYSLAMSNTIAR